MGGIRVRTGVPPFSPDFFEHSRFREATKFLFKAESVASIENNVVVLRQRAVSRRVIEARNKDIPNYVWRNTPSG